MTDTAPSAGPVTYRVTSQTPTTIVDSRGQPVEGVNVAYELSTGSGGTVFVPAATYSADTAIAAVKAAASQMAAVDTHTGTV
jgi:hypothetical protein